MLHVSQECVVSGLPRPPNQLKVVCDTMLQGLGKPLRSCGVDTITLQNGERHMKAVEVAIANLLHSIGLSFFYYLFYQA